MLYFRPTLYIAKEFISLFAGLDTNQHTFLKNVENPLVRFTRYKKYIYIYYYTVQCKNVCRATTKRGRLIFFYRFNPASLIANDENNFKVFRLHVVKTGS